MLKRTRLCRLIALFALLLASYATAVTAQPEPIIFGDLTWNTARVQNRIAQYIIEKGYGYSTAVLPGATADLFEGLRQGESDVLMELWLVNLLADWREASLVGEVVSLGENVGGLSKSAFSIPAYVQAAHPGLDEVVDLKDEQYQSLFATPDSGGKARLVSCPATWACHAINQTKIENYGLAEHVHIAVPESETAIYSKLLDLYERGEPWLGYLDSGMAPAIKLDMVQLEEPPYSDQCWATTKACAYNTETILIVASPGLLERAPDVSQMLRKWKMDSDYFDLLVWLADSELNHEDAAVRWLNENENLWSQWVTEDAATVIRTALDRGEHAEGWPNE